MDIKIVALMAIIILGYFYLTRMNMSEGFSLGDPIQTGELRKPCKASLVLDQSMDAPFVKKRLLDVDDYEYNLVFQQEGDREISK
jgi:hypothetical protein